MLELVREHPRFGYRRIAKLLQREGHRVGLDRAYRLWRREGLKVPRKPKKKRRLGILAISPIRTFRLTMAWILPTK